MVSRLNTSVPRASVAARQQAERLMRLVLLLPPVAVLLSTALCILHCHLFMLPRAAPPETTLIVFASDAAPICHTPFSEAPAPLTPLDAGTLRALSEAAPTLAGLLLLTMLVRGPALPPHTMPLRPLATLAPEPPPPRP